uniref:Uncharacterized protein n=1 Tax=Cajanus cajan TaxID=3821 RepID=A0A151QZL6_CAJCA|nr:hypothetical protein KK1_043260 [Cajanus cajan]
MESLGKGKRVKHIANRDYPRPTTQGQGTSKKKKQESSRPEPEEEYSHSWFTRKSQEETFNESFACKDIVAPKVLYSSWLIEQGFTFPTLLSSQGVSKFVGLSGLYYPDLVRVFYSNLGRDENGALVSEVKGIKVTLSADVFLKIGGLTRNGIKPTFNELKMKNFSIGKDTFFMSMLRDVSAWEANKEYKRKEKRKITYNAGGLRMEDRLLHYVIVWILAARGSNHAQISEEDMALLAAFKNNIQVDWVYVVEDIMLKTRRLMDCKCPYAVFISKVLVFYKVPLTGEAREVTRDVHDIKDRALKMMKLVKTDAGWIAKEDVPTAETTEPSQPEVQTEEEEGAEEPKPLSTFELSVLAKLDDIRETQRRDYQELKACFESISERLDAMNIPYPEEL